jgi:hypothetical protein
MREKGDFLFGGDPGGGSLILTGGGRGSGSPIMPIAIILGDEKLFPLFRKLL